ncbi:MAG: DNA repair protein RecN [Peptococcaceae bacterium]|nr:DNA repair protein RecN [Peptococcaceae bacterium]
MLVELSIESFGLMDRVRLSFREGLIVFTGETGAGKSMLVDALDLLLGGRAAAENIRHGVQKASVEGVFCKLPQELCELLSREGYEPEEGQLFLAREVNASGRNVCRVQGKTVPWSLYRTFCVGLVDIHGQMEHQSLLRSEYHGVLLDRFAGDEHLTLRQRVESAAREYLNVVAAEREFRQSERELLQREDLLRFQADEIERINPGPDEDRVLEEERGVLMNAEKIMSLADSTYGYLYEGGEQVVSAYDLMGRATRDLAELAHLDPSAEGIAGGAADVYYALEDVANRLRSYRDELDFQPGRLDEIEERLAELGKLKKYAPAPAEADVMKQVLDYYQSVLAELESIEARKRESESVHFEMERTLEIYNGLAAALTLSRQRYGDVLAQQLGRQLEDLDMKGARVEVVLTAHREPTLRGAESVEFFFSANVGEPVKPLAKVASGGEMSRLMLAFKSLLSALESVDTFIFDEVDSGVGGTTIAKVADKLAGIARNKQVFVITHSAQVAAVATCHFGISKEQSGERTVTSVTELDEETRVGELARMLGGGTVAGSLAKELMQG